MRLAKCTNPETGLLLPAYELRALTDEDNRRFELHLMSCSYCLKQLQSFQQWSDTLRENPSIRQAISQAAAAQSEGRPAGQSVRSRLWPSGPVWLRPAALLGLLVLLMLPAVIGVRDLLSPPDELRPVQTITLLPTRAPGDATLNLQSGLDGVINFAVPGDVEAGSYEVTVIDGDGRQLLQIRDFREIDPGGMGRLILPHDRMRIGVYRLLVENISVTPPLYREYRFRVEP